MFKSISGILNHSSSKKKLPNLKAKKEDVNSYKYKIIINGKPIYASPEEAQKLIENYNKRNHPNYLIDETWRTHDTIYLNDFKVTNP